MSAVGGQWKLGGTGPMLHGKCLPQTVAALVEVRFVPLGVAGLGKFDCNWPGTGSVSVCLPRSQEGQVHSY